MPALAQVVVARESPRGEVGAAFFLVDLGALGVKDAFTHVFESTTEYHERLGVMSEKTTPLVPVDLDLAVKVVGDAVAYARKLGFAPHRDYLEAARYLEGAHPEASGAEVPLGYQGKPFYASGPHDNPTRIINQLTKAVGEGNFHFIAPISPSSEVLLEDEDLGEDDDLEDADEDFEEDEENDGGPEDARGGEPA
jgi:hypothetical protein